MFVRQCSPPRRFAKIAGWRRRFPGIEWIAMFDVVVIGLNAIDYLCCVPRYPVPGEKLRMTGFSRQGGGQVATALVALSRWGLRTMYVGNVGGDEHGRLSLSLLRGEGGGCWGGEPRPRGRLPVCGHPRPGGFGGENDPVGEGRPDPDPPRGDPRRGDPAGPRRARRRPRCPGFPGVRPGGEGGGGAGRSGRRKGPGGDRGTPWPVRPHRGGVFLRRSAFPRRGARPWSPGNPPPFLAAHRDRNPGGRRRRGV